MLPIDKVKSGSARDISWERMEIPMTEFFRILTGQIGKAGITEGTKTFEIQYDDSEVPDKDANDNEVRAKLNNLPASVFVEINWDDGTMRTFFATRPFHGYGRYKPKASGLWEIPYGHNGVEHYDFPPDKGKHQWLIRNITREYTHEPRHRKEGAFAQWYWWLHNFHNTDEGWHAFVLTMAEAGSHILNWKQGINWVYE
tara:strand:- start:127 stop:723 length:597 start_codon:yes stop_codon:yes gene_type:complete